MNLQIDNRPGEINRVMLDLEKAGRIRTYAVQARGDRPPHWRIWLPDGPDEGLTLTLREAASFCLGARVGRGF